jgi:hypothetical protein
MNQPNSCRIFRMALLAGLIMLMPVMASAQFVTIARKIKSMRSGGNEVATVILDASAGTVFKALSDTLFSLKDVTVTRRESGTRRVEFNKGGSAVSMQVDSLDRALSQITVLASGSNSDGQPVTDLAVRAILGVCKKVGKSCSVKDH